MWPLGHAAIGYLLYTIATRTRFDRSPAEIPVLILLVGTQFPDLVDKPLAWYVGVLPTGRTLGHSFLFLLPLSAVLILFARRYDRTEYGIAFAIGAISHTIVDIVPALWGEANPWIVVWPLVPVESYENGAPTVLGLLRESLTDPYFLSEFVFAAIALLIWRWDGYPGLTPVRNAADRVLP